MASGQGPIYDDTVTFPTNKTDGGQPSTPHTFAAVDANNQGSFDYAARTAIRSGIYHGALDQSASLPPLSSATPGAKSTHWTSNGGQLSASEEGGPYIWIHNTNYINLGDKRFGAVPDWDGATGTANDAALAAAIAALPSPHGPYSQRVLYIPAGYFRLTSPATFFSPTGSLLGLRVIGEGDWVSQLIIDPAVAHGDGLRIQNGQGTRLEGFGLIGRTANPAGTMLTYAQVGGFGASNDHVLHALRISSHDAGLAYDTGITFDIGGGGNSEFSYNHVTVERFINRGVYLAGSQQYGHNFWRCNISGAWDGLDHTANGGRFGIELAGGQFSFRDGNCGGLRGACFYVHASTNPAIVVDGCDTEVAYQIFGDGNPGDIAGGSSTTDFVYRNSRYSNVSNSNMDPDKVIAFNHSGSLVVEDNYFFNGGDGDASPNYPKIMVASGGIPAVSIRRNFFQTRSSYLHDPVTVIGTPNRRAMCDIGSNVFVDATLTPAPNSARNEILNFPQVNNQAFSMRDQVSQEQFWIPLSQFNAAAGHQDIEIANDRPAFVCYDTMVAELYNYIITIGAVPITMRVGTTSGGQELIKDFVVGDSGTGDFPRNAGVYGKAAAERGTDMPGVMGSVEGISSIWVRLTAASGNLGDGSTSNIVRGIIHLVSRSHLLFRYIV